MKTLLKHLLVLSTILLSNVYCTDNNSNVNTHIEMKESCDFDNKYLQDIIQYSSYVLYSNKKNKYCIFDEQNQQFILFQEQQLLNNIKEILTDTYINILNTPNLESKLNIAEPFYRIVYNQQKLSFILNNNDLNVFKIINNILDKIKPLCKEHAVANLGPKSILYGLDMLEGTLPTINNQFTSCLNFQIDFTKTYSRNKKEFKTYYDRILTDVSSIQKCINVKLLNKLIIRTNKYIDTINYFKNMVDINNNVQMNILTNVIDERISIVNNLNDFFVINSQSIFKNLNQILTNRINLLNEAWDTQVEEIDINELLKEFFYKIDNIDYLQEKEKTDLYQAFFNNLFINKYIRERVLLLNNTETINKLNNILKQTKVREFNINTTFEIQKNNTWSSIRTKNCSELGKKLEVYYSIITMFCNNCIHTKINPIIDAIKQNNNSNIKELKNTILEYLEGIKNYMINETKKYESIMENNQSLVPINFWKQKQIDFKTY